MNAFIILMAIMAFVLITADPYRDEPRSSADRKLQVQQAQKDTDQSHQLQKQPIHQHPTQNQTQDPAQNQSRDSDRV